MGIASGAFAVVWLFSFFVVVLFCDFELKFLSVESSRFASLGSQVDWQSAGEPPGLPSLTSARGVTPLALTHCSMLVSVVLSVSPSILASLEEHHGFVLNVEVEKLSSFVGGK